MNTQLDLHEHVLRDLCVIRICFLIRLKCQTINLGDAQVGEIEVQILELLSHLYRLDSDLLS